MNYSYWNGDDVIDSVKSPWAENVSIIGTDAFQCGPGVKASDPNANISIFISSLFRSGNARIDHKMHKYGFELVVAFAPLEIFSNKYKYPEN